jgi:hypothetical protein
MIPGRLDGLLFVMITAGVSKIVVVRSWSPSFASGWGINMKVLASRMC